MEPTQAEAMDRAYEISNGGPVLVERVRNTSGGGRDKWRKASQNAERLPFFVTEISLGKAACPCESADMLAILALNGFRAHTEAIGFWAAVLTTIAFAPQVVRAWRTGGEGLSWMMLVLFASGVGLWFLYGFLRMSAPLMTANGLTGLQILILLALKIRHATRYRSRYGRV